MYIGNATEEYNTHYKNMKIQPIKVIIESFSPEEFKGYLKGNIIKYALRAGKKEGEDALKDITKLGVYADWLREYSEKSTITLD